MKIENIHPELRKLARYIPSLPVHHRLGLYSVRLLSKMLIAKKQPADLIIEEVKLEYAAVRIYKPRTKPSGAGILWIHGGGLIMGFAAMNDKECSLLAKQLNVVVVSVEYRLAPEHKYPAAIDDCFDAWCWFQSEANKLKVDPARIAIAGQSAGGGLAANLTHRIYDKGGIQPAAQVLIYAMLDDRTAKQKQLDPVNHLIWNNKNNRGGWAWYLGQPAGQSTTPPYAVPARREDLSGLPSAWLGVGDIDLFYKENCQYAARLREVEVNCQLHVVPMAPHAFEVLAPNAAISQEFTEHIYQFLQQSLTL